MKVRRSGLLLCTVALVATGCSADMTRFAPTSVPPGVDTRSVGSIAPAHGTAPSAQQTAGAPIMPAADVAPRAPGGWPPRATATPTVYSAVTPNSAPLLDRGATGSIGLGPVRGADVASRTLAPVPATGSNNATPTPVSEPASTSIADKVRRALPSMPARATTPRPQPDEPLRTRVAAAQAAIGWNGEGGRVTVGEGQTLYNLSKRFGVPVAAIMAANGISDPTTVRIGQTLVIPRYTYDRAVAVSAPDADPNVRASTAGRGMIGEVDAGRVPAPSNRTVRQVGPASVAAAAPASNPIAAASGTVTVNAGDTLYSIARRNGVSLQALRDANGLAGDGIRVGQSLRLPGSAAPARAPVTVASTAPSMPATSVAPKAEPAPIVEPVRPAPSVAAVQPPAKPLPRVAEPATDPVQTASITPVEQPSAPVAASAASDGPMRWPVNGRIVREFGGAQKGIDIAVPNGTSVRAAEGGKVIYAGSGLKELGKTVLIQHPDGLVTVYGHADALKVAKGQTVQRGDVIASSGMTGDAETPRVHFQVRKGSTPVNPGGYLN